MLCFGIFACSYVVVLSSMFFCILCFRNSVLIVCLIKKVVACIKCWFMPMVLPLLVIDMFLWFVVLSSSRLRSLAALTLISV